MGGCCISFFSCFSSLVLSCLLLSGLVWCSSSCSLCFSLSHPATHPSTHPATPYLGAASPSSPSSLLLSSLVWSCVVLFFLFSVLLSLSPSHPPINPPSHPISGCCFSFFSFFSSLVFSCLLLSGALLLVLCASLSLPQPPTHQPSQPPHI